MFVRNPSAGTDGTWGTADDDSGDLHLLPDSPAIDAGSNLLAVDPDGDPLLTDLDGNVRIQDNDNNGTATVNIGAYESSNQPPVADAGGPYVANEGDTFTLDGTGSTDPDGDETIVSYEWDLDHDSVTFDIDTTGQQPSVSYSDDFTVRTIALRVTDNIGATSVSTATLTVNNVAPTVTADEVFVTVDEGTAASMTGMFGDVGDDVVTVTASFGTITLGIGTWSWSLDTTNGPGDSQDSYDHGNRQ